MSDTRRSRDYGHVVALAATIICVAFAALLFFNRQFVVDQLSVWQYKPSSDVTSLAVRSGMNDTGKFYFYSAQPAVEEAEEFNKQCDRKEDTTAILGCYNGRNIYIYNVTNQSIDGIREVTAAHEMLHAAYDRLGGSEKSRINSLLETEYAKLKTDTKLAERMAFYDRTEPGERDNELHSVIGTEIASISPELEAYYKKYFTDRNKVTTLHQKYAAVFDDLQNRSQALISQLTALNKTIEQNSATYNKEVSRLNQDIETFNAKANAGNFSSQSEFQTERANLLTRANQLDAQRQSINADVTTYESLRQQLAAISSQSEVLNKSIDSSLAPAPSL
jgi:hypothetical protein